MKNLLRALAWTADRVAGPSGFINVDLIKEHIPPASLKDRVKVFVCGESLTLRIIDLCLARMNDIGPPGQVAHVAGKKSGMKQGEIGGILKELGYTEDQVLNTTTIDIKSF